MRDVLSGRGRWPALARDLAMLTAPDSPVTLELVCRNYGLEGEDLEALARVPAFAAMYRREKELVDRDGGRASARYMALSQATLLSEKLFSDAASGIMESRDSLKLLELLFRGAGLMDAEKGPGMQVAVQTNVSLPLPRIPRLAHALPAEEDG